MTKLDTSVPSDEETEKWSNELDEAEKFDDELDKKYQFRLIGFIYPMIENKIENYIYDKLDFDKAEELAKEYYEKEKPYMEQRDLLSSKLHSLFIQAKEKPDKEILELIRSIINEPELNKEKAMKHLYELEENIKHHREVSLNGFFNKFNK